MEVLTAAGLASAAGLNAYLPLLLLGLLSRATGLVALPQGWDWLSDPWALGVLGALLAVEVVADKVPVVDHVNDVLQTAVRPTAGGIAVSAGTGTSAPALVDHPAAWLSSGAWVPLVGGAALALVVHLLKAAGRGVLNAATAGLGAPVASTAEDVTSLLLSLAALLAPVLVALLLVVLAVAVVALLRRRRRARGRTSRLA